MKVTIFNKTEKSFIVKISLIMATRMLGLFMILPVFAIFAIHYDNSSPLLIGVAIGIYGLTQALLQIPFGYMSDRFGRKPMLILGLIIFAIGGLISAMSDNIYLVILGRFIAGAGAIASVLMAFVADIVEPKNRSKANAIIGMQIGLAFMLAIVIGPLFEKYFGLSGIFYLTSIMAVFALILVFRLPNSTVQSRYLFSLNNIKQILVPKLLALDFSVFALHFILTAIFITIPVKLVELNNSLTYLIIISVSFALIIPFIIIAEKKSQHKNILLSAVGLLSISQILFYLEFAAIYLTIFLTLFFAAFNLAEAIMPSILARWSDANNPNKRGLIMSFYSTSQFLGAFSGGIIAGFVIQYFNDNTIFIVTTVLTGIWFLIIFRRKVWQE